MKIGFLTAIREDQPLPGESFYKRAMVNLAPLYLAGYLEKRGVGVEIQIRDQLKDLDTFAPEVVGITSVTENFECAKRMARDAKSHWNSITVLGGVHITSLPKTLPKEFDVGVVGEGEETFCDLVQLIKKYGALPPQEELRKIPGIVFHTPQGVFQTPFRFGVKSLDEIPVPSRHRYIKNLGIAYMMTSRGCPYTCSFCVIPSTSEGYRTHSPEYVVEEIRSMKTHYPDLKHIRLFDDLYIVDRRRVEKIADLVVAEGLNQELNFGCWGRANLIDERMVKVFQKMNMLYVAFGAESGSSRVLSQIKPGTTIEQNQRAIELLSDHGIKPSCSVILGHPTETEDDIWATYEFIERNMPKLGEVEFNVAIPWPGTELWEGAKERGIVSENMDFNVLRETGCFSNYNTEDYPYLNERISPDRFDDIVDEFKKLYWKSHKKLTAFVRHEKLLPENAIAQLW